MRKKILSKDSILDAAIQIIKEENLDKCSMRNVAKSLGVAVGTLYNYYPSHDLLLEDLFNKSWQKTFKRMDGKITAENTCEKNIEIFIKILKEDIKNRKGIGRAVLGNNPNISAKFTESQLAININELLFSIIKHEKRYSHLAEKEIKAISQWMALIIIHQISSDALDDQLFLKELYSRFL